MEAESGWRHCRRWLATILDLRQTFLAKYIKEIDTAVVCGAWDQLKLSWINLKTGLGLAWPVGWMSIVWIRGVVRCLYELFVVVKRDLDSAGRKFFSKTLNSTSGSWKASFSGERANQTVYLKHSRLPSSELAVSRSSHNLRLFKRNRRSQNGRTEVFQMHNFTLVVWQTNIKHTNCTVIVT